jgi:hypothetical protein
MRAKTTFTGAFKHPSPMTHTVFEVSGAGVSSSGKGEKAPMMIRGQVDRQSTLSTPQFRNHRKKLFHYANSLAEIVVISYSTMIHHMQDSLWNGKLPFAVGAP